MNSSTSSTPDPNGTPPESNVPRPSPLPPIKPPPGMSIAPPRLPEGALPAEKPDSPPTQAENRLRFWAGQNGYTVKAMHVHNMPGANIVTYFCIFEGPKE